MRTERQLLDTVRGMVDHEGNTQKSVAEYLEISESYLCDILKERRPIAEKVAKALGFNRMERVFHEK